jgi:hypothetical protein
VNARGHGFAAEALFDFLIEHGFPGERAGLSQ